MADDADLDRAGDIAKEARIGDRLVNAIHVIIVGTLTGCAI